MVTEPLPEGLSLALSHVAERLGLFAGRIRWFDDVTSTNDVGIALAERGEQEGAVITADGQTAGRGRLRRVWASPHGAGIYASVVLRPASAIVPLIPLAAGVAIAEGIHAATGLQPLVKWPNDVVIGDQGVVVGARKLAGILAEGGTSGGGSSWVVLGFGISVLPAAYPPDVAIRATSLEAELGRPVDRGLVLAECLAALSARYGDLQSGRASAVVASWRARASATFGRRVEWDADGATQQGVAQDVDERGALLVSVGSGLVRVISGEVRWI